VVVMVVVGGGEGKHKVLGGGGRLGRGLFYSFRFFRCGDGVVIS
jgi:hypothetical protein